MNITEQIGTVVATMRNGGETPYYLFGHRLEISNRLVKKDSDSVEKYKKYPLVAFNEQYNTLPERRGNVLDWTLNIAILAPTKKEYWSKDRDINVFVPVLDPLYEDFLVKIRQSGLFFWTGDQDAPPHSAVRRKFFGITSNEGNVKYIFNDPLDAVELINLKLSTEIC
jgi:hypothetical protein